MVKNTPVLVAVRIRPLNNDEFKENKDYKIVSDDNENKVK